MKTIDVHTHGIGGFDTTAVSENDILRLAEIHGSHGVSEIIPTVYPSTIGLMRENIQTIRDAMSLQMSEGRAKGTEAMIAGIHLEGPFLNPARCGALNADSFIVPDESGLKELLEGFENIVRIMTISPELDGAPALIKTISDMGIIASMGHSDAIYSEAEEGFNSGARGITHIFNAMRGIHHREPGIAGFGLMNKDIYIEVIADPFHLDHKMIKFIFSVKDPGKIIIISDTVRVTKTEAVSDGIMNGEGRLMGGSLTVTESAERLIRAGIDKDIVMKAISENPARYLLT
jgi:N-acetylglucosamine-6-phosphate deacetylase